MWDDRVLFVIAALSALAYSVLRRRNAELERNLHFGRTEIKVRTVLVVAVIAVFVVIVGSRVLLYWDGSRSPNVGNVIAVLLARLSACSPRNSYRACLDQSLGKETRYLARAFWLY